MESRRPERVGNLPTPQEWVRGKGTPPPLGWDNSGKRSCSLVQNRFSFIYFSTNVFLFHVLHRFVSLRISLCIFFFLEGVRVFFGQFFSRIHMFVGRQT